MTDPMQLLRATNPVDSCEAPDFGRLLTRIEHEPAVAPLDEVTPRRKTSAGLGSRKLPRIAGGRHVLAALVPTAVAVAVAAVAIVSLHDDHTNRTGPQQISGSLASPPGQARGRVVVGSMHPFTVSASGFHGQTWGAEWFRTTAGQICVQAGRQVGSRLGYVDIDGTLPHDGRFQPWAPNTAADARCIDRPAHGGIALTVVERVANSGHPLPPSGSCTAVEHSRCPAQDTTVLYYGLLGPGAVYVGYGSQQHGRSETLAADAGADGGYVETTADGGLAFQCAGTSRCPATPLTPRRLVHPGARAFVLYTGAGRSCTLRGPGTNGVMSGRCLYGLTLGPSPDRLTAAQVRARVHITTRTTGASVHVTALFRSRVASSRIAGYSLMISTPPSGCSSGRSASSSSSIAGRQHFHAGATVSELGSAPLCSGTYHGAVTVQPLVGASITVGRFSFQARPRR